MIEKSLAVRSESEAARYYIALARLDNLGDAQGFAATLPPQFLARHPAAPDDTGQGLLACLYELQEMLRVATGMAAVSLAPHGELQSEYACMAMMRAYHDSRGDTARTELLAPAPVCEVYGHAAAMCGYTLREIAIDAQGVVDATALKTAAGPHTAALLLAQSCASDTKAIVSDAGALLHGRVTSHVKVSDMDAISLPIAQGEGEADAWAVGASRRLAHFLPLPVVGLTKDVYRMLGAKDLPLSIGRLGVPLGNLHVLLRAYLRVHVADDARGSTPDLHVTPA